MTTHDTLPGPDDVNTHGRWKLPVIEGEIPVSVTGLFIGMASSRRSGHNTRVPHEYRGRFSRPGPESNCSTCRWTETRVIREDGGGYAVHILGLSLVPGETLRCTRGVVRVRTAYEVVESLTSRVAGGAHLTRTPAMALAQCAAYDVPLRDAYENRAVS